MSNMIQKAAQAYAEVCRYRYLYTFSNGRQALVIFKPQNFVHLAGLRKLSDLVEFQASRSAISIYKDILRGRIDQYTLQRSVHYNADAQERIENLARLSELLYTRQAVFDFDPAKARVVTRLKSSIIFFQDDGLNFYLMLGVAEDGASYYPETFFLRFDSAYIQGQTVVRIERLEKISAK